MKKTLVFFLHFFFFFFIIFMIPTIANAQVLKKGFYKIIDSNLSPDTTYTIENISFNERIYILIFDANATALQGIRLKPQSQKYNLVPLQLGYKFVLIGDGDLVISPNINLK